MPNSPSTCGEDLPHRAASDDDLLCGISGLWRELQMQKPSGPRNSSMSGQLSGLPTNSNQSARAMWLVALPTSASMTKVPTVKILRPDIAVSSTFRDGQRAFARRPFACSKLNRHPWVNSGAAGRVGAPLIQRHRMEGIAARSVGRHSAGETSERNGQD